jgi:hypothetical protein
VGIHGLKGDTILYSLKRTLQLRDKPSDERDGPGFRFLRREMPVDKSYSTGPTSALYEERKSTNEQIVMARVVVAGADCQPGR